MSPQYSNVEALNPKASACGLIWKQVHCRCKKLGWGPQEQGGPLIQDHWGSYKDGKFEHRCTHRVLLCFCCHKPRTTRRWEIDQRFTLSPAPLGEHGTVDNLISDFQPPECFLRTSNCLRDRRPGAIEKPNTLEWKRFFWTWTLWWWISRANLTGPWGAQVSGQPLFSVCRRGCFG